MIYHDITYLFHFNRPFEILNVFVLRSWHDILQNNLEREYKSLTSCVCCTSMNGFLLPWSFSSISSLNAWYLHSIQKGKRQWNIFYCIFNINSYRDLNLWLLTPNVDTATLFWNLYIYLILTRFHMYHIYQKKFMLKLIICYRTQKYTFCSLNYAITPLNQFVFRSRVPMRQKWIFGMWQTKFKINDVQCLCVISYQMKYLIWYNNYSPQVHPYLSFVSTAMLLLPLFKYARLNRCIYVTIKCNYRINLSDPKKCDQQIKVQGKWSHVINIAYWNRKFLYFYNSNRNIFHFSY